MSGATSIIEVFLANFPTPILPKIREEPTREGLIELHRLVSGNGAPVLWNLEGGRNRHLALTMTSKEYSAQTGLAFAPPHKRGDYLPTIGDTQEQALIIEKFRKNQALFQKYTAVDIAFKKQIITAVEPVFLSPLVEQLTVFLQFSTLTMLRHIFLRYGTIEEIDLEENTIKIMGPYDSAETLAQLIDQLEKGREFTIAGGETIDNAMMVSKGITLLTQMVMFNEDTREWRCQTTDQKTWAHFKIFFHLAHLKQMKAVTTARKGGCTAAVQNIYCVMPPPTEEHHESIDHINSIVQGMQTQSYELEVLAQANAVLISSNTVVMKQFAQMTVTINSMQAQLKTLTSTPTNQTRSKRKYYCWSCGRNYTHGSKP